MSYVHRLKNLSYMRVRSCISLKTSRRHEWMAAVSASVGYFIWQRFMHSTKLIAEVAQNNNTHCAELSKQPYYA